VLGDIVEQKLRYRALSDQVSHAPPSIVQQDHRSLIGVDPLKDSSEEVVDNLSVDPYSPDASLAAESDHLKELWPRSPVVYWDVVCSTPAAVAGAVEKEVHFIKKEQGLFISDEVGHMPPSKANLFKVEP